LGYFWGIPLTLGIVSMVLNFILAGLLALTYNNLTEEEPIVFIEFSQKKEANYSVATLKDSNGSEIGKYEIWGDQWRLDVQFYKMHYFANVIGIGSKYALDRFEDRYKNINDANTKKTKHYQLESHTLVDKFAWFFDTTYGSSTYTDVKSNVLFTVYKTPTGIMVREKVIATNQEEKTGFFNKAKNFLGL